MRNFVEFMYRITLSLWTGAMAYLALVATPAIFAGLPREAAGDAVGAIFPSYMQVGYGATAILFVTAWLMNRSGGGRRRQRDTWALVRVVLTGAMLAAALYGGLFLFPEAERLRAQIPSLEPGAVSAAREAFGRVHGLSFGLNALALFFAGLLLVVQTVQDVGRRRN